MKVQIITQLHGLVMQNPPEVFLTEDAAGARFEEIITEPYEKGDGIGFRRRNYMEGESWEQYEEAFQDWADSSECPFDAAMDFEIHWHKEIPVNADNYTRQRIAQEEIKELNLCAVYWGAEDIHERSKENYGDEISDSLTDQDCADILSRIEHKHDCNLGITWDTLDYYISEFLESKEKI